MLLFQLSLLWLPPLLSSPSPLPCSPLPCSPLPCSPLLSSSPLVLPHSSPISLLSSHFSTPNQITQTHLLLIPPVIGCSQFYLTSSFKSRNMVCRTKACKGENSLLGLDLQVQNSALRYIATNQISIISLFCPIKRFFLL